MAAGLAHELNNPAAAARRASSHLMQSVTQAQCFVCSLSKMLKPGDWKHLGDALQDALSLSANTPPLASVTRSDREEALATWLQKQNVTEGWKMAPALVNAGLDPGWFEAFIGKLPAGSAQDAVGWLESNLMLKSLTGELQQSTARISELVKAVKAYSYMDQPAMQEVDIHEGIENTLTVLGHKLKGITVNRPVNRAVNVLVNFTVVVSKVACISLEQGPRLLQSKPRLGAIRLHRSPSARLGPILGYVPLRAGRLRGSGQKHDGGDADDPAEECFFLALLARGSERSGREVVAREDPAAAVDAIETDYAGNCAAAREIAEEYFGAERVVGKMMQQAGL
jgi:hypothetical protein